jgi:hypothetical protein
MGIPGPKPKPAEKRARQNAPTFPTTELERPASAAAPRLPGSGGFVKATRAWYRVWCRAPQASQFLSTDWLRLHMTARLVDEFYRSSEPLVMRGLLAEIRLNEQKLGGTPEDRLRLRWRLRETEEEEEEREERASHRPSRRRADPRLKLVRERPS